MIYSTDIWSIASTSWFNHWKFSCFDFCPYFRVFQSSLVRQGVPRRNHFWLDQISYPIKLKNVCLFFQKVLCLRRGSMNQKSCKRRQNLFTGKTTHFNAQLKEILPRIWRERMVEWISTRCLMNGILGKANKNNQPTDFTGTLFRHRLTMNSAL